MVRLTENVAWLSAFLACANGAQHPLLLESSVDPLRPEKVILQKLENEYLRSLEKTVTETEGDLEDIVSSIGLQLADRLGAEAVLVTPLQSDTLTLNPVSLTARAVQDLSNKGRTAIDVTSGDTRLVPGVLGFLSPGESGIKMEQIPITNEYDLFGIFKSSIEDTDPFVGEQMVRDLMKLISF